VSMRDRKERTYPIPVKCCIFQVNAGRLQKQKRSIPDKTGSRYFKSGQKKLKRRNDKNSQPGVGRLVYPVGRVPTEEG
jgi:hypothetical protein